MNEPAPDYYAELAAQLHQVADQIAALAGQDIRPLGYASMYLTAGFDREAADVTVPVVDAVAAAFGAKAETTFEGRGERRRGEHKASVSYGPLRVTVRTDVPAPPTRKQTLAELQRENAELRARLATQGGEGR